MSTTYETDVVAWANEQAQLIRAGKFDQLDLEHLAEEIEDLSKREKRELASRMAVLLAHLLKWQFQPGKRTKGWSATIRTQRDEVIELLEDAPSLRTNLSEGKWHESIWKKATGIAEAETDHDCFPKTCPWAMADILTEGWLPSD